MLFDEIAKAGGKPLMWKTGHSLIKSKMAEIGSPLAGEMSGHIFFADSFYGFDDALYCGLRLLNIVANGSESLAEMRDALPQPVNTPELRFDCADDAQVRRRRGGQGAAAEGRRQGLRHRRRARQHRGRLVAAARLQHPGRAGGALRGGRRGGAASG